MKRRSCLVTGAAGFVGSHLVDRLLALGFRVVGLDNLVLGKRTNLSKAIQNKNFSFRKLDVNDYNSCLRFLRSESRRAPFQTVWHMAANSDIQAGGQNPGIDLERTFLTTFHVLKVMRELGIPQIAFASSSAIYGNQPGALAENHGPLTPISNYGAMKLASEGAITAALEQYLERAWIFRFPNVVGSRATHGVIYDFFKKLQANPRRLDVLGDGKQRKPYLHVGELVEAMLFIFKKSTQAFNCFNIAPNTATTVRFIAQTVVAARSPGAEIRYGGGPGGWVGDVPRFQYSTAKLRRLGWRPRLSSDEAVRRAVREQLAAQ